MVGRESAIVWIEDAHNYIPKTVFLDLQSLVKTKQRYEWVITIYEYFPIQLLD